MKQVVFVIVLIAMVSLTGCLDFGEEDVVDSDDLVNPTDAYSPPEVSTIMVDSGYTGYWDCDDGNNNSCVYIPCTKHGYQDLDDDGDADEYCDIDGHQNNGPQSIVKKIGNKITIECIHNSQESYCKGGNSAYVLFTSIEGLQEMIYCYMAGEYYDGNDYVWRFHKCEATLGFEPVSFEITNSLNYIDYSGYDYYYYVSFRVF